jgi:VCBS repeat-containing protein
MDGGGGSDTVDAGAGADSLIYRLGQNAGARDIYKGGSGIDTLALHLTQAEWVDVDVRAELQRYVSFLDTVGRNQKGEVTLRGNDFTFNFSHGATLTVQTIENLAVYVQDSSGQYVLLDHLASVIEGDTSGTVTEAGSGSDAGVPTATGVLTADDLNGPDDIFQPVASEPPPTEPPPTEPPPTEPAASESAASEPVPGSPTYGVYSITSSGEWTYTLNNDHIDVQALNDGDTLIDTFTVYTQDGTGQDITVTIEGTTDNHAPTALSLTPANPGAGLPQIGLFGTLSTTDADAGDTHTYSLVNNYNGLFVIDGNTVVLTAALEMSEIPQTYVLEIQSTDQFGGTLASPTIYRVFTGTNGDDGIDAPWLTGTGNYIAFGLDGYDVLQGGAGDDWLFGGRGGSEMYDGTGNDMFVMYAGESQTSITGFGAGDKIALQNTNLPTGALDMANLSFSEYVDPYAAELVYNTGIIYLQDSGILFYAADGSADVILGSLVPDASLVVPALVYSDFIVL